ALWIQRLDQFGVGAIEGLHISCDVVAQLIRLVDRPARMTAHAGQAILHGAIRTFRIADNAGWPLVEAPALRVGEHVALQPVGQAEDELAAVMLKGAVSLTGCERVGEEVLLAGVAAEVVTAPVNDAVGLMTLDKPIVARHAGAVE